MSCAVPIQTTRVRPSSTSTSATTFIAAHANATCAGRTPTCPVYGCAGAVDEQAHARRARIIEAFGVGQVLEPDREADAPVDALAARCIARASRQPDRVARQLLRLGLAQSRATADHLGNRQRAGDGLPCR